MRILLLTHFFPPYDHIGSARTGKTAKYLELFGHDVRVIAARDPMTPFAQMPLEIPSDHVIYTRWVSALLRTDISLNRLAKSLRRPPRRGMDKGDFAASATDERAVVSPAKSVDALKRVRDGLRALLYYPDAYIGWLPFGLSAARQLLRGWRPDVILASGAPVAAFIIAGKLSKEYGIPWVAEFRDLWVDNHLYPHPEWRRRIEARLEKKTISTAAGLVTVSEPLADSLREKFSKDVEVIYNGFDPGDHGGGPSGSSEPYLTIVYTGWVYRQQTLEPLFEAMRRLGASGEDVRVVFYRSDETLITRLAAKYGVAHLVQMKVGVSFMDSLRAQKEADVLLYLSWNDREHTGIFSGKLLQYFGARRPILAVGYSDNAPARLIFERGIGFASADSGEIADRIAGWLGKKKATGTVGPVPEGATLDFTREAQTRRLERFLARVSAIAPAP